MIWESPGYLLLIFLLVIIFIAVVYQRKKLRELRRQYFSDKVFEKLYNSEIERNHKFQQMFFYSGLLFLILALAGPKIGTEVREVKRQGIDILVMLDVSKSMKAEDVRPNRLDKAKFEILRMVDRLRGDRIGLITFTGESILLSPLTADYSAFRLFLNLADTDAMPSSTTDFSAGFRVAMDAFEASSESNQEAAKVLLILSDGEDHGPDYSSTLQQIRNKGVFIFTVGIGTPAGGTIPVYDPTSGRLIEYLRDAAGQVVITKLESNGLRQIADQGQGTYYEISRSSDGMDGFLSQIEELEKREFATQEFADYKNQYQWFAGIGIVLFFISLVIPQYKPITT
jgi:Ca-activated chloride channel family protein